MTRSDTVILAQWFVLAILRRHWVQADFGGSHMAHAKRLLGMGYKLDEIQGCCLGMVKNPDVFEGWSGEWPLKFMTTILKGEPPYIEQWLTPPAPPPIYETKAYDTWVISWGAKAVRLGLWDGLYLCVDELHRLSSKALTIIMGKELATASLRVKESLWTDVKNVERRE